MKLLYSNTSPFVRKVRVVAHELGVSLELVTITTLPTKRDPVLVAQAPLSKIPVLITDDGGTLFDSRVICEYLDTTAREKTQLIPREGAARWKTLRTQALADGITDAAVAIRYETFLRQEAQQSKAWIEAQTVKIQGGLDALEHDCESWEKQADLGQIAAACAIGYLEFRRTIGSIRENRAKLFAWYDVFRGRASMKSTEPA